MKAPFAPGDVVVKFRLCSEGGNVFPIGMKTVCLKIMGFDWHDGYPAFKSLANSKSSACSCCFRLYEPSKPEVKTTDRMKDLTK